MSHDDRRRTDAGPRPASSGAAPGAPTAAPETLLATADEPSPAPDPAQRAATAPGHAAESHPPSPDDLRRATDVLEAAAADRVLLAGLSHDDRKRLLVAAGRVVHPEILQKRRLVRALRQSKRRRDEADDRAALATTGIREARESAVFVPPPKLLGPSAAEAERPRELKTPRTCYVCKAEYRRLHFFYDALCPECAELNYAKRFQAVDLHGRVALVTGARVKIGYQAALKLLRSGATVVATTRFPHDAARRYAASRTSPSGRRGSRCGASTCVTRRASRSSAASSTAPSRDWTCSSTTRARPCGARPGSTSTSWRSRRSRSPRCPRPCSRSFAATTAASLSSRARRPARRDWRRPATRRAGSWRGRGGGSGPRPAPLRAALPGAVRLRRAGPPAGPLPGRRARRGPAAAGPARDELVAPHARRRADAGDDRGPARERRRARSSCAAD